MGFRIGIGTDLHLLQEEIPLRIGGINIPYHKGAAGHSDGDALLHAVCDALLGASVSGDIGRLFSDKDPAYRAIDSRILLQRVNEKIAAKGYNIVNIDATIHLQEPVLQPYIKDIQAEIERVLQLAAGSVSVKAKTGEKTGAVGEGYAIEAVAICLLQKNT
ncbi:MAG: 2-C-methyl-D-erythritol 2,4-cyclodiphosphate synthase [Bacteroidales bacterium]|nr:2-C-methyl-D-erythritol 2,4-cyclodiphosphate synthase [Bacteroidales bacterium]